MKTACCQCSRVIFGAPTGNDGRTFCNNDFCLEEFRKAERGVYRHALYDQRDLNSIFFQGGVTLSDARADRRIERRLKRSHDFPFGYFARPYHPCRFRYLFARNLWLWRPSNQLRCLPKMPPDGSSPTLPTGFTTHLRTTVHSSSTGACQ